MPALLAQCPNPTFCCLVAALLSLPGSFWVSPTFRLPSHFGESVTKHLLALCVGVMASFAREIMVSRRGASAGVASRRIRGMVR